MIDPRYQTHLFCNARNPLVSGGKLRDELILYNVSALSIPDLLSRFANLTGKRIEVESEISTLSGGQKVILMCLLALLSPARRILFMDLFHSLDEENKNIIQNLLSEQETDKEITIEVSSAAD